MWRFLKSLKPELLREVAIPLLGVGSKKMESTTYQCVASTPVFIVAIFTTSKLQNQLMLNNGWVDKNAIYIHNVLLPSHTMNESYHLWQMKLEDIMLKYVTQAWEGKYYMISFICESWENKFQRSEQKKDH